MQRKATISVVTLLFLLAFFAVGYSGQVTVKKIDQSPLKLRLAGEKFLTSDIPTDKGATEVRQGGDDIDNATVIPGPLPVTLTGTTATYNNDYDEACPNTSTSPDVVYSYTPVAGQRIHVTSCNSAYWTKLFIYDEDTNVVACNQYSDSCLPDYRAALYDIPISGGITYYIVVDGWGGQSGEYEVIVEARPPIDTLDVHPALADNGMGLLAFADEYNEYDHYIYWQASTDNGSTWTSAVYWTFNNGWAKYPQIDYFGLDTTFYGTCVCPVQFYNGAPNYLVTISNAADPSGYSGSYWNWSSYGWHDMKMVDIACAHYNEDWQWGFQSMIHSTTYTDPPMFDGPHVFYQTDSTGYATISWYNDLDGCNATSCDLDRVTAKAYAVYDHYDDSLGLWQLFARQDDAMFFPDENGNPAFDGGYTYTLGDSTHFQYPAVAAYDSNVVIVGENWAPLDPDNKDLVCFYTMGEDLAGLTTSSVVATTAAERFPEIQHINGLSFLVTYVQDSALYAVLTEDGGMTWGTPVDITYPGDKVVSEYRGVDIAESNGYEVKIAYEYYTHMKGDGSISIRIITHTVYECLDEDEDGVCDDEDNCPGVANSEQENSDGDSHGDACDNCPLVDNEDQLNSDNDSHGDVCDNCPNDDNEDQLNSDNDSHGDACDNCPLDDNEDQADSDEDGIGDVCDWVCGDVTGDGSVNILDPVYLISWLYQEGPPPDRLEPCDVNNGDGNVNILDIAWLIAFLYQEGPPPSCP